MVDTGSIFSHLIVSLTAEGTPTPAFLFYKFTIPRDNLAIFCVASILRVCVCVLRALGQHIIIAWPCSIEAAITFRWH